MRRGKLIVIEGGDGCGKTSTINALKATLPSASFVFTREPGGTNLEVAELIRGVILHEASKKAEPATLLHLFWASRVENVNKVILPALQEGKNVVVDRFDASTYAYQICGERHSELAPLFEFLRRRDIESLHPNYLFLDVDPKVGRLRALKHRGIDNNHFDERDEDYYDRVQSGYIDFYKIYCSRGSMIVDANKSLGEVVTCVSELIFNLTNLVE